MSVVRPMPRFYRRSACAGRQGDASHAAGQRGFSALELLFVTTCMSLLTAMAIPRVLSTIDRSRGIAAARYLAGRMAVARARAVNRSANVAVRFAPDERGMAVGLFADGDGDGVRAADIAAAIDPPLEPAIHVSELFSGVAIALTDDSPAAAAVEIGGSTLMSFSPAGTSSSGTIHVRSADGTQWAVRVLGATARIRVLRWVAESGEWVEAF